MAIRTDNSLWAWGSQQWGQLGLSDTTLRNVPTRVGSENNWSSVSAGNGHTMAIKTDNSLWAWGRNDAGQYGDGTWTERHSPVVIWP